MMTKEQFERLTGIRLIEVDGKIVCYGKLNLYNRKDIIELPNNLKVLGNLDLNWSGVTKLPKGLEVEGFFNISRTEIEELPEDTKFGGSLYVNYMEKPFSFPKVVKVNGSFECSGTTIKRMSEELHAKWDCDFSHSKFDKLPKVMKVGDSLYLNNTNITELPEGLKEVYGLVNIRYTNVSKLPNNFVAYGGLKLDNTPIEDLSEGLIVSGELDLRETNLRDYSNLHKVCCGFRVSEEKYKEIEDTLAEHTIEIVKQFSTVLVTFEPKYKGTYLFENEIGKYIYADGIFTKIVEEKGNVYHVQRYGDGNIIYLITDGEGRWSHGYTLEKSKADLIYKISNRNKDSYKDLTLDSELSFEDAIMCYRVITGACSFGTRDFIENRLGENKNDKYTINEIITLTEGEYGNESFRDFFCKD